MADAPQTNLVVVAIDGSPQAQSAFEWFAEHLYRPTDKMLLVHAAEPPFVNATQSMYMTAELWDQMLQREKEKAHELEEKYANIMRQHKIAGTIRVLFHSKPAEALVATADEEKASMIVMGTRGLGTVRRTIMGSVSDFVVHHAHCPVLVCRH